jgi:hypothetical protein
LIVATSIILKVLELGDKTFGVCSGYHPQMAIARPIGRRWFQFGIAGMVVVTTIVGLAVWAWRATHPLPYDVVLTSQDPSGLEFTARGEFQPIAPSLGDVVSQTFGGVVPALGAATAAAAIFAGVLLFRRRRK